MPLFPRLVPQVYSSGASYSDIRPLLEALFHDPSFYNQSPSHASCHRPRQTESAHRRAFSPSFDVRETEKAYVLEGEFPGLGDKSAVDIEFTDHQTLLVKGRIERSANNSSTATPAVQADQPHKISSGPSEEQEHSEAHRPQTPPHPTVEDVVDEDDKPSAAKIQSPTKSEASQNKEAGKQKACEQVQCPKVRYWISERQTGEFQRTFSFPTLVDQDGVTAKLAHGILTIVVPKRATPVVKKVEIQ